MPQSNVSRDPAICRQHLASDSNGGSDFVVTAPIFDFSKLSPAERIELAEQLWDSLDAEAIDPSPDELELVRRRRSELTADGDPGEPWQQVIDEITERGG